MKVLVLVALFAMVAQIMPSCGGEGKEIVGWVEEKFVVKSEPGRQYMIVVNHVEYDVIPGFWSSVQVGDFVKYDGFQWTIVRKSGLMNR
jgi:hypothetical protein